MSKLLYPAIHVRDIKQAREQTSIVLNEGGASGVFLVNNGGLVSSGKLLWMTELIKKDFPKHFIGVNPLGMSTTEALACALMQDGGFDGLWTDNGGVLEDGDSAYLADGLESSLEKRAAKYFGSIAMKYQPKVLNLSSVARVAAKYFDVVVTSGEKTGVPPSVEKVRTIRDAIGDKKFALASGVDSDNIVQYLPYADIFIVGTSLWVDPEDEFTYHPLKVRHLKEKIDAYN